MEFWNFYGEGTLVLGHIMSYRSFEFFFFPSFDLYIYFSFGPTREREVLLDCIY